MKASEIYVGRIPTVSKHRAMNNVHVKAIVDRLDAIGEREAADTIIWMLWWRDLDAERERFLIEQWQERLAESVGEAMDVTPQADRNPKGGDSEAAPSRSDESGGPAKQDAPENRAISTTPPEIAA